jgi:hypothetical protein
MINLRRFRDRCTPPAIRARFWKWSEVSRVDLFDIETAWPIRDGMSRVTWQPSNAQRKSGSDRSCQRRTRGSGDSPCSKKISLPPGLKTRSIPSRASNTPGIVHRVKVLTTVSTLASAKGIHSPGQVQKLDFQLGSPPLLLGTSEHPWSGFESIDSVYRCWIVMSGTSGEDIDGTADGIRPVVVSCVPLQLSLFHQICIVGFQPYYVCI